MMLVSAAMAAPAVSTAVLRANGVVVVNEAAVSQSAPLFDADVVKTSADGVGTIAQKGSSVVLPANSSVQYSHAGVNLLAGSMVVKTTASYGAQIESISVKPAASGARFSMVEHGNYVTIAALEGSISITQGEKLLSLNAGTSVTLPLKDDGTKKTAPDQPSSQGGNVGSARGGVSPGSVTGIGASLAAAIAIALAGTQTALSQSKP
jgi:ferric-dicitrate binding protein FerR (iron transport regulator)